MLNNNTDPSTGLEKRRECEACVNYYRCHRVNMGECEDYVPPLGRCHYCGTLLPVGAEAYKFHDELYCAPCVKAYLDDHRVDSYD